MDSGYSSQLDHLILFFIYNTDYFSKLLIFHLNFFSNKIVAIGTSFAQVKIENRFLLLFCCCCLIYSKLVKFTTAQIYLQFNY